MTNETKGTRYRAQVVYRGSQSAIRIVFADRSSKTGYPTDLQAEREIAARIYGVAAELERRAASRNARWAISPAAHDLRLDVELDGREDIESTIRVAQEILTVGGFELGEVRS